MRAKIIWCIFFVLWLPFAIYLLWSGYSWLFFGVNVDSNRVMVAFVVTLFIGTFLTMWSDLNDIWL